MATVNKNFRIKQGLIVEGTTGTINGQNILTETGSDQYILDLVGGTNLIDSVASGLSVNSSELSIDRAIVDTWYDASGAALTAETNANGYTDTAIGNLSTVYDELGAASTAQSNAEDYADGLAANYDPAGTAASEAGAVAGDLSDHEALSAGVHGVTGSVVGTTDTQDLSNKRFIDTTYFTDGVTISNEGQIGVIAGSHEFEIKANYGDLTLESLNHDVVLTPGSGKDVKWGADVLATQSYADQAESDAKAYTENLIGDITVDGTSGNTVTDRIATAVADLVDSAPAALDTLNELAAALGDNVDGMTGIATAIGNKLPLAGGTMSGSIVMGTNKITGLGTPTVDYDAATKKYVDDQTTSDVAEGTNLYFTNQRALDATSAAYDPAGSAATAKTNAETTAQNALDNVLDGDTPFTDLNINDVTKQVAATTTSLGSVPVTAYQFNKSAFKSGKFLVKIDNGTHNEISEILVTLDSSDNVAITEYAIVGTNGSRGTITADVDSTHCRIRVNPVNDSTITVSGTVFNA